MGPALKPVVGVPNGDRSRVCDCVGMLAFYFELLFRVPLGGREVFAHLLCCATRTVARDIALDAPSLRERSGVQLIMVARCQSA